MNLTYTALYPTAKARGLYGVFCKAVGLQMSTPPSKCPPGRLIST